MLHFSLLNKEIKERGEKRNKCGVIINMSILLLNNNNNDDDDDDDDDNY